MQLSKTFINFKLWYLLLHKITKQYLDFHHAKDSQS